MLQEQTKATPNGEVIVTELDGEAVLLHLGTKMYYSLNPTGLQIWKMLEQDVALDEIGTRLQQQYDLAPERARQCVLNLVKELSGEQLVSVAS